MPGLLLNNSIFVEVDNQGYLQSKPYEGTLGILVRARVGERGSCALKIPRLVADTPQENHHIASLLEEERRNCTELFLTDGIQADSLLPVHESENGPLAAPAGHSRVPELREQTGQWVLIQFSEAGVRLGARRSYPAGR